MNPLISIIVPIYNVEKYLRQCVDSIINQTYTNLEIILVDDGSPDGCPAICDEYAQKDSRIKVIHKENGGVSSARNAGLNIMTGEYVSFIDSDDYISSDHYSNIISNAPFNIAILGITTITPSAQTKNKNIICNSPSVIHFNSDYVQIKELILTSIWGYPHNKVFNRDLISEIRFKDFVSREDFVFMCEASNSLNEVLLLPYCSYYYVQHDSSILHSRYSGDVPDICSIIPYLLTIHPLFSEKENSEIASHIIKMYLIDSIKKYIICNDSLSNKAKLSELKKIFDNSLVKRNIRFSKNDNYIFFLFTICCKFHLSKIFYFTVLRIWKYE